MILYMVSIYYGFDRVQEYKIFAGDYKSAIDKAKHQFGESHGWLTQISSIEIIVVEQ